MNKGLIIGIAAVAVLGGGAAVAVNATGIGQKAGLASAVKNTFSDMGYIGDALNFEVFSSDKLTLDVSYQDMVDAELATNGKKVQLSGSADVEGYSFDFLCELNDKEIKAYIPDLYDATFVYNYKEGSESLEDLGIDTDTVDSSLKGIYEASDSSDAFEKEVVKPLEKKLASLDTEKLDKEEFTIDGKDVKCSGTSMVITGDDLGEMADIIVEYCDNYLSAAEYVAEAQGSVSDLEEWADELRDSEDITLEFYTYKNMLACVRIEVEGTPVEILFEGGDFRAQNMTVSSEGEEIFTVEGSSDKTTQTCTVSAEGEEYFGFTYNKNSGALEIESYDGSILDFTLLSDKDSFEFSCDEAELGGPFSITAEKGAEFEEFTAEEYDLNEADEGDLYMLALTIVGSLSGGLF